MAAFLFDNDASHRIARWLQRRGHSVVSLYQLAPESGLRAASDQEVLVHAALFRLVLVTHNEEDFVALHDTRQREHSGIIVLQQVLPDMASTAGEAIDQLVSSQRVLANELYQWTHERGWERRLPARGWERL